MTVTDQSFWQDRWENGQTGWMLVMLQSALIEYMKQYPDKKCKI